MVESCSMHGREEKCKLYNVLVGKPEGTLVEDLG
jgi:hypothetical protein